MMLPVSFEATQNDIAGRKIASPTDGCPKPYNGEVWKTALSAIKTNRGKLKIGTFPFDFGVCVIKKLSDDIPEIPEIDFDYKKDFSLPSMLPVCDIRIFYHKKVSYFTSLFNTPQEIIERTAKTVLNQENGNWEWVVVDDSDNTADAERLKGFFEKIADPRVKYHRFSKQTGGNIGLAKKRATSLCTGDFLAELDHDDLLMLDLTDTILDNAGGYDFIYTNSASVVVSQDGLLINGEMFPKGFAMGYGMYRMTYAENPLTERFQEFAECVCSPINPKTRRSIVGVPNHIRIWSKRFYDMIGGHNPEMPLADDYDLIIRSFLAGGRFLHLDILGYLQTEYKSRTVHKKNDDIQFYWNTILVVNNELIKGAFEMRGMQDWAYEYYQKNFGFKGFYSENRDGAPEKMCIHGYKYFEVPTVLNAPAANSLWIPKG